MRSNLKLKIKNLSNRYNNNVNNKIRISLIYYRIQRNCIFQLQQRYTLYNNLLLICRT